MRFFHDPLRIDNETDAAVLWRALEGKARTRDTLTFSDVAPFHEQYSALRQAHGYPISTAFCGVDDFLPERPPAPLRADADPWGLIVETRPHPNLAIMVDEVCDQLNIPVQIMHGPDNRDAILTSQLARRIESGQVVLTELGIGQLTAERYNSLFVTRAFWDHVIGRGKILVFQTDAILCPKSPYRFSDFLHLDYIGSAWGRFKPRSLLICDGGNGGLSLRDWTRTVECLDRFPARNWPAAEDKYFAFHMELIGARIGTLQDSVRFGSQHWFLEPSFGAHKISAMNPVHLGQFLDYCPEAARICEGRTPNRNPYRRLRANLKRQVLRQALRRAELQTST